MAGFIPSTTDCTDFREVFFSDGSSAKSGLFIRDNQRNAWFGILVDRDLAGRIFAAILQSERISLQFFPLENGECFVLSGIGVQHMVREAQIMVAKNAFPGALKIMDENRFSGQFRRPGNRYLSSRTVGIKAAWAIDYNEIPTSAYFRWGRGHFDLGLTPRFQ